MPRRPKAPAPEPPKRRARNSGSAGTRASDGRAFAILPKDLDPKRRPVYSAGKGRPFASEDDATRWLDAEIAKRRDPSPKAASLAEPLGSYLARWYALYSPSWPSRTAKTYRQYLRHWAIIGHVPLGQLTREHIQAGIAHLQTTTWQRRKRDGTPTTAPRHFSPRTIATSRVVLGIAIEQLVPDILPVNPVRKARIGKTQRTLSTVWDGEQVERFLSQADSEARQWALALRLVLRRGLRRGEVLALRWNDIDWRRGLLRIDETAGDRAGETGETKGRRIREIALSDDLLRRLREHRSGQHRMTPWVFDHDGKPYTMSGINRAALAVAKAAGLPPIGLKDMRATCATLLLDEGVALVRVSRLLGHADVATTARHYERALAHRQGRVERLADELDAALDRATAAAKEVAPATISEAESSEFEDARLQSSNTLSR